MVMVTVMVTAMDMVDTTRKMNQQQKAGLLNFSEKRKNKRGCLANNLLLTYVANVNTNKRYRLSRAV